MEKVTMEQARNVVKNYKRGLIDAETASYAFEYYHYKQFEKGVINYLLKWLPCLHTAGGIVF